MRTKGTRRLCWVVIFPVATSEKFQEFCNVSGRNRKKNQEEIQDKSGRTGKDGGHWPGGQTGQEDFAGLPSFLLLPLKNFKNSVNSSVEIPKKI